MILKTFSAYERDYTTNFDTQFRPFPKVVAYNTSFIDLQYGGSSYWDEDQMIRTKRSTKILTKNPRIKWKVKI